MKLLSLAGSISSGVRPGANPHRHWSWRPNGPPLGGVGCTRPSYQCHRFLLSPKELPDADCSASLADIVQTPLHPSANQCPTTAGRKRSQPVQVGEIQLESGRMPASGGKGFGGVRLTLPGAFSPPSAAGDFRSRGARGAERVDAGVEIPSALAQNPPGLTRRHLRTSPGTSKSQGVCCPVVGGCSVHVEVPALSASGLGLGPCWMGRPILSAPESDTRITASSFPTGPLDIAFR